MLAAARTFALAGVQALPVEVEVDITRGLPSFAVVGLPDAAVREARERVRAATVNCGFEFPQKRITVSLAPSDLRKAGPGFDLAIAAALLVASGQLAPGLIESCALAGELGLDGRLRQVRGGLAMAEAAAEQRAPVFIVPEANGRECALVAGLRIAPLSTLGDLRRLVQGELPPQPAAQISAAADGSGPDLADLRGQAALRRALEVAAAGGHNLLVTGPPGAGKSMAARRLPSILPPLAERELVEVVRIAGAAGIPLRPGGSVPRPFRAPHHTISPAGLVGGGTPPRPGEITLAHHGVLFLDELPEFPRRALEALRQPLESGRVDLARAQTALRFPCRFQLVAAANPCPCGHGEESDACRCTPDAARRYAARLSGALADRIDLVLRVGQPDADELAGPDPEPSSAVRKRVLEARRMQELRWGVPLTNAGAPERRLRAAAAADAGARRELAAGRRALGLSGRGWARALRTARTLADLDGREAISAEHVAEALTMRAAPAER